jgi:hypothetical protein
LDFSWNRTPGSCPGSRIFQIFKKIEQLLTVRFYRFFHDVNSTAQDPEMKENLDDLVDHEVPARIINKEEKKIFAAPRQSKTPTPIHESVRDPFHHLPEATDAASQLNFPRNLPMV